MTTPPGDPFAAVFGACHDALAHNLIRNHRRREVWATMPRSDHGLVAVDEAPEDRLALLAALRALSPDDREVLMLTAWEGLDAAALGRVARVLGRGCPRPVQSVQPVGDGALQGGPGPSPETSIRP